MGDDDLTMFEKSLKAGLEYFSNKKKENREQSVVKEFLKCIQVRFSEHEIKSLEQKSKVDVQFGEGSFQVKEILDPNSKRHALYKKAYNSVKKATSINEVSLIGDVEDIPEPSHMYSLAYDEAKKLASSKKYSSIKSEIDLIFYITRSRASLIQEEEIKTNKFSELGWRSVSCLNTKQAVILYSAPNAPVFMQNKSKIYST